MHYVDFLIIYNIGYIINFCVVVFFTFSFVIPWTKV